MQPEPKAKAGLDKSAAHRMGRVPPIFGKAFDRQSPVSRHAPVKQAEIRFARGRREVDLTLRLHHPAVAGPRHRQTVGHLGAVHLHRPADDDARGAAGEGTAGTNRDAAGQRMRRRRQQTRRGTLLELCDTTADLREQPVAGTAEIAVEIDQPVGRPAGGNRTEKPLQAVAEKAALFLAGASDKE